MTNSTNKEIEAGKEGIYVFAEFWSQFPCLDASDKMESIYRKVSGKNVITYKGSRYEISYKRSQSGIFTLPCIFVKEQ